MFHGGYVGSSWEEVGPTFQRDSDGDAFGGSLALSGKARF